jgi:hypothetical protein
MLPTKFLIIWPSGFREEFKKSANQKQESPVAAMFGNRSGRNEQPFQFTSNFAVIGIDSLTVCILFGEILIFHSRVMGLYSSNTIKYRDHKTINSNNYAKFEVNWPRGLRA